MWTQAHDVSGQRFGRLTVLCRAPNPTKRRAFWLCVCDCGEQCVKMGKYLLNGETRSCGCVQRASRAAGNPKYGGDAASHREYTSWRSMKSRCLVKSAANYRFYGAKGVRVCDAWVNNFSAFLRDMGPCPPDYTLDRIDPAGDYTPENCRWASWETQHQNLRVHAARRNSRNLFR